MILRRTRVILTSLSLLVLTGCDFLFFSLSNYKNAEFPLVDPASFNNSILDQTINPYRWKSDRPQFAGMYFSYPRDVGLEQLETLFGRANEIKTVERYFQESQGKCRSYAEYVVCSYNKIVRSAGLDRDAVCLKFEFSFTIYSKSRFEVDVSKVSVISYQQYPNLPYEKFIMKCQNYSL